MGRIGVANLKQRMSGRTLTGRMSGTIVISSVAFYPVCPAERGGAA